MRYKDFFRREQLYTNKIVGGKGDAVLPSSIDPEVLKFGISVEMEHTNDPDIAKEIAIDHIRENPAYYDKLFKAGLVDSVIPKKLTKKERIKEIVAKGMVGLAEVMKFFELATDAEKMEFERLVNSGDNTQAWIYIKKFLKDKGSY